MKIRWLLVNQINILLGYRMGYPIPGPTILKHTLYKNFASWHGPTPEDNEAQSHYLFFQIGYVFLKMAFVLCYDPALGDDNR